jgi:hypothetical protein
MSTEMRVKRGPGRPALGGEVAKRIRFTLELEAEINAIIAARLDKPDFCVVVRQLLAEAIEARKMGIK